MFSLRKATQERVSYFGLWAPGPHNFWGCVGWVPLPFKRHWVPHFLSNLTHFSRCPLIFTHIFPVFVICTTSLGSFFSSGFFIDPQFSPCITCVQYCSVHRGMFSRLEGYHEYIGGISSVHRGMFSTSGGYHDGCGRIP